MMDQPTNLKDDFETLLNIVEDITKLIETSPVFGPRLKKSEYFQSIKTKVQKLKENN